MRSYGPMSAKTTKMNSRNVVVGLTASSRTKFQGGFGFSLMAVVVTVLMGLTVTLFFQQVSTQSAEMGNLYAASQARWAAMSGIEWGLYKAELGEDDVSGTFDFYNSTVTIDTSSLDEAGNPLTTYYYRVMSEGVVDQAERRLRIIAAFSLQTAWADVSIIQGQLNGSTNFTVESGFMLNDSIYFGGDVTMDADATVGNPANGEDTHIFHHSDEAVSPSTGTYYTSGAHPEGNLALPVFERAVYEDMIATAAAVSKTEDNKFKNDKKWKSGETLDFGDYAAWDFTVYVNGKVQFEGAHITGGSLDNPGILVADDKITFKAADGGKAKKGEPIPPDIQTTADDNIIFISKKDIVVQDSTYYGLNHEDSLAEDVPETRNELYAHDDMQIKAESVVWAQLYCQEDIKLEGKVYGICLAPKKFTFEKSTSFLRGAVFAKDLGGKGDGRLKDGQMILNHIYNEEYFKIIDYGVDANSLLEY